MKIFKKKEESKSNSTTIANSSVHTLIDDKMIVIMMMNCFSGTVDGRMVLSFTLRGKRPYSKFFWSVFSHIRTEYEEVSLRIQSNCRKIRTRKTPNTDTFHAVLLPVGTIDGGSDYRKSPTA